MERELIKTAKLARLIKRKTTKWSMSYGEVYGLPGNFKLCIMRHRCVPTHPVVESSQTRNIRSNRSRHPKRKEKEFYVCRQDRLRDRKVWFIGLPRYLLNVIRHSLMFIWAKTNTLLYMSLFYFFIWSSHNWIKINRNNWRSVERSSKSTMTQFSINEWLNI